MRLLAPRRPPRRSLEGFLVVVAGSVWRRALVQHHGHVRTQLLLHPGRQLRRKYVPRAIVDRSELDTLLRNTSRLGKREDLVAAGVRKDRAIPAHKAVESPGSPYEVRSRSQIQMIRVPQHDACPHLAQIFRREPLDRALGPDGHEDGRLHGSARRMQDAGASLAVAGDYIYGDGRRYSRRPPFSSSMASPKE